MGGGVVVDAYDIRGNKGVVVLSLVKQGIVQKPIRFEGDKADIIFLFTDILKREIDKVVDEEKVEMQFVEKDIKRGIKKLRKER